MAEDKMPSVHKLGMTKSVGGKAKKTKKGKKVGRNSLSCQRYKLEHRRERNKLKRLKRHLNKFPHDLCATKAVDFCKVMLGIR